MPLWRGGPNTRTLPTVLLTPSASKAADMAHLCVPQNQALGVCRGFAPDIQICGTHGRKNLVNATIISNAEEEEEMYLNIWQWWIVRPLRCTGIRGIGGSFSEMYRNIRQRRILTWFVPKYVALLNPSLISTGICGTGESFPDFFNGVCGTGQSSPDY